MLLPIPGSWLMAALPPIYRVGAVAPRKGGSATKRDHSRSYKRLRLTVLAEQPLCVYCFNRTPQVISAATIVDHIIALSLGGTNDRDNLTSACKACNDSKGADERRFLARGYSRADVALDPNLGQWFRWAEIV